MGRDTVLAAHPTPEEIAANARGEIKLNAGLMGAPGRLEGRSLDAFERAIRTGILAHKTLPVKLKSTWWEWCRSKRAVYVAVKLGDVNARLTIDLFHAGRRLEDAEIGALTRLLLRRAPKVAVERERIEAHGIPSVEASGVAKDVISLLGCELSEISSDSA